MRDFIGFEIQTAELLPYRLMFDDSYMGHFKEKETFKQSNIYFFTKVKKLRFDLKTCKLIGSIDVKIGVTIGDSKIISFKVPLMNFIPGIKEMGVTKKNFHEIFGWVNGLRTCKINIDKSSNDKLYFDIFSFNVWICEFALIPEFFETNDKIEKYNSPEIVYIGQSHDMLSRMESHSTLHKANTMLKDDEEIRIYFLTFIYCYGTSNDKKFSTENKLFNVMLKHSDTHPDEHKIKINLLERFLINYFKPIYNDHFKNISIDKNKLVIDTLLQLNIEGVTVGYAMEGSSFKFWSTHAKSNLELVSFDFKKPEQGFTEGIFDFI